SPASSSAVFGQSVSFTATLTNLDTGVAPQGTVTFLDGGNFLGTLSTGTISGHADIFVFTTAALTLGSHTFTAAYNGDNANPNNPIFTGSARPNSVTARVTAANTATALVSSPNPRAAGQAVTFTATVTAVSPSPATPTGSVQFAIDDTNTGSPVTLTSGA